MRIGILCLLTVLIGIDVNGQENKNLDFVLMVNDEVYNKSTNLIFKWPINGKYEQVSASYWPGNLTIAQKDYIKLTEEKWDSLILKIIDDRYVNGKQQDRNYELPFNKLWLTDLYGILRIYDLTKKKYKKTFHPLSEQKIYTYEFESPSYTFLRVRKK